MRHIAYILLLAANAWGACSVGSSGFCEVGSGKTYATIGACTAAMSAGQTCRVFAGNYSGNFSIPSGSAGNINTVAADPAAACTPVGANNPTPTCGVIINGGATAGSYASLEGVEISTSGSGGGVSFGNSTRSYLKNSYLYQTGSVSSGTGSSYLTMQGNTLMWIGRTAASGNTADAFALYGDHHLVENNDISHYRLGINYHGVSYSVFRNNTFHDQADLESGPDSCCNHTDATFAEPSSAQATQYNVIEGNAQYNAMGPNAKSFLSQNESCPGCTNLIIRHNLVARMGSGGITNDKTWPYVKVYNNTWVDMRVDGGVSYYGVNDSTTAPNSSYLNDIYYFSASISSFNPYTCPTAPGCHYGGNTFWTRGTASGIANHTYGNYGSGVANFLSDGNFNIDPAFVRYLGVGNASNDYHLSAGSPAISKGTYLTTANGSGSNSTTLVVADASYFQDGYGITGVQGDCVRIGATNTACITNVNYSTNTLTITPARTWSNTDPIYLYKKSDGVQVLTGSLPDLGALPYGAAAPPCSISPTSLPAYTDGQVVSQQFAQSGCTAGLNYSVAAESPTGCLLARLGAGGGLSSAGMLSGTAAAGTCQFQVAYDTANTGYINLTVNALNSPIFKLTGGVTVSGGVQY